MKPMAIVGAASLFRWLIPEAFMAHRAGWHQPGVDSKPTTAGRVVYRHWRWFFSFQLCDRFPGSERFRIRVYSVPADERLRSGKQKLTVVLLVRCVAAVGGVRLDRDIARP